MWTRMVSSKLKSLFWQCILWTWQGLGNHCHSHCQQSWYRPHRGMHPHVTHSIVHRGKRDLINVFQNRDYIDMHFLWVLSFWFVYLFLHLIIVNQIFLNVVDRAAVNGSTSSLTDDLEVEPPQKTKPNCQYWPRFTAVSCLLLFWVHDLQLDLHLLLNVDCDFSLYVCSRNNKHWLKP